MSAVADSLEQVRGQIAEAAGRAGRDPGDVRLVAVSKTVPLPLMREAMAAGQQDFGENRVQEAAAKYKELGTEVRWHFVGRLQRNKIRHLVGWVDLIHSLDRTELATEIDRRADRPVEVLVEVNVSEDPARGGVQPAGLMPLLESASALPNLRVVGLMVMAPVVAAPEQARPFFRRLAGLRDEAARRLPGVPLRHLSMGMSQDYTVAVEEGATLVRIGEAIFGRRPLRARDRVREKEPVGTQAGEAGNVRGKVTS
jgi:pyridoxal phosphate enzyme (YggS family)